MTIFIISYLLYLILGSIYASVSYISVINKAIHTFPKVNNTVLFLLTTFWIVLTVLFPFNLLVGIVKKI